MEVKYPSSIHTIKIRPGKKLQEGLWTFCRNSTIAKLSSEISESLDGVSVSTSFAQSRLASVSTSFKFPSLDEFQSRHPRNFPVSVCHFWAAILDFAGNSMFLIVGVLQRSARVLMEFRYRHLLPNLVFETQIFSVSVSVLSCYQF